MSSLGSPLTPDPSSSCHVSCCSVSEINGSQLTTCWPNAHPREARDRGARGALLGGGWGGPPLQTVTSAGWGVGGNSSPNCNYQHVSSAKLQSFYRYSLRSVHLAQIGDLRLDTKYHADNSRKRLGIVHCAGGNNSPNPPFGGSVHSTNKEEPRALGALHKQCFCPSGVSTLIGEMS